MAHHSSVYIALTRISNGRDEYGRGKHIRPGSLVRHAAGWPGIENAIARGDVLELTADACRAIVEAGSKAPETPVAIAEVPPTEAAAVPEIASVAEQSSESSAEPVIETPAETTEVPIEPEAAPSSTTKKLSKAQKRAAKKKST